MRWIKLFPSPLVSHSMMTYGSSRTQISFTLPSAIQFNSQTNIQYPAGYPFVLVNLVIHWPFDVQFTSFSFVKWRHLPVLFCALIFFFSSSVLLFLSIYVIHSTSVISKNHLSHLIPAFCVSFSLYCCNAFLPNHLGSTNIRTSRLYVMPSAPIPVSASFMPWFPSLDLSNQPGSVNDIKYFSIVHWIWSQRFKIPLDNIKIKLTIFPYFCKWSKNMLQIWFYKWLSSNKFWRRLTYEGNSHVSLLLIYEHINTDSYFTALWKAFKLYSSRLTCIPFLFILETKVYRSPLIWVERLKCSHAEKQLAVVHF